MSRLFWVISIYTSCLELLREERSFAIVMVWCLFSCFCGVEFEAVHDNVYRKKTSISAVFYICQPLFKIFKSNIIMITSCNIFCLPVVNGDAKQDAMY